MAKSHIQKQSEELVDRVGNASDDALAPLLFGGCWLESKYSPLLSVQLAAGQSLRDHVADEQAGWNPDWLLDPDVGFTATDSAGRPLPSAETPATADGPVRWNPALPLPKVDDQTSDEWTGNSDQRRRLAGEILLLALWRRSARSTGVPDSVVPAKAIVGQTRGARFKNSLSVFLSRRLPGWKFPSEVPLNQIFGLHLRKDVGSRKSDILAVVDQQPHPRLMAVISSKWSWRSDRGTEAAQMVPLNKYRPDVPYVVFTAEFVRAREVGRESVEDRAYHLCREWVGAWMSLYDEWGIRDWATLGLADIEASARTVEASLGFGSMEELASDLDAAGTYR
ncbi:hypothetical protein [Actinoplanes sp. NPDC049265]|uniref:hypothetical protein n=1 Tax=Actinoplanes sp. NPDC049265 TaxID=3363902 RepID=UPI0037199DE8